MTIDFSLDFSDLSESLCNMKGIGMEGTLQIGLLVESYKYLLRHDYCQGVGDGKVNEIWSLTLMGLRCCSETIFEPMDFV